MNRFTILTLMVILDLGCVPSQKSNDNESRLSSNVEGAIEILFQVKTYAKEDLEIFEDGIIPWISIKGPEKYFNNLMNKDEIVLIANEAILLIDYPLNNPVEIEIKSEKSDGFTRGELIKLISREYNRIYKEEEESSQVKTIPLEEREDLINRNETNGKYGIWGHDIDDLDLSAIIVKWEHSKKPRLELFIES
jgi:hypothetical protein